MDYSDCHCHLGTTARLRDAERLSRAFSSNRDIGPHFFHLMSTNHWDMAIIADLIKTDNTVVPYFGVHPWYSHLYSDGTLSKKEHYSQCLSPSPSDELLQVLPDPICIDTHMERIHELAAECERRGIAYGIGEIGLDKLFRIPANGFYGNLASDLDVALTQVKVTMEHQKKVLVRQLQLAHRLGKQVSLHCVKAHGALFDIVSSGYTGISYVVLHSYSGSLDQAKTWKREFAKQHRKLCFSFSFYINVEKSQLLRLLVQHLDPDQILTESDMPIDRFFPQNCAGYFEHLGRVSAVICESRGWTTEEGMLQLRSNSLRLVEMRT